jgi:A/G-specific adenine glycosylase
MNKAVTIFFKQILMQWHENDNNRIMPWKGIKDPYKIWLSEIILQQTRVEQGLNYYEKFVVNYPTIQDLADAKDEEVFKLWEGLGYYNRCKNLLFTARTIVHELNGVFPNTYDDLLALKGIGPYTAAAIASFAYNLPYAVVDGNVFRVLARFFGIETATDNTIGKQLFTQLANEVLDKVEPGKFNQAIMDFGATVCKPALPNCSSCVLQQNCTAFKKGLVNQLPIKEKILTKKNRFLSYFIIECNDTILVHKRMHNDVWQNLFEFYVVENESSTLWTEQLIQAFLQEQLGIKKATISFISGVMHQQLTHQKISGQFIKVKLSTIPVGLKNYTWLPSKELKTLAFPKFINQFLESENVQGSLF